MTNKDCLKHAMDNDFNKKRNYLKVVERKEEKKVHKIYKHAIASTMLVALLTGSTVFTLTNINNKTFHGSEMGDIFKDNIVINDIKNKEESTLRLDGKVIEVNKNEILDEFSLKEMNIPIGFSLHNSYTIYTREDKDSKEYPILHDYVLNYCNEKNKSIRIAISKIGKPMRDYSFMDKVDKISTINNSEVVITKYEDSFIATFKKESTTFDIETTGITQEEVVNLIKSMI